MAIIKTRRTINFTTLPNELINDPRLRWADLGLLVYLLSKPDTWSVRVDVLVKERGIGRDAVYEIMKRLREAGYARLSRFADGSTEWTIYDNPNTENTDKANNPHTENPDRENPDEENPDRDNPHGYKRKTLSKERVLVNKEETIKKKDKKLTREDVPEVSDQTFDDFMQLRKAKRLPFSMTAMEGIKKEASRAGITLETALKECCMRGWAGFKAEWYQQAPQNYSKQQLAQIAARSIFGNDNEEILINGEVIEHESTTKQLG